MIYGYGTVVASHEANVSLVNCIVWGSSHSDTTVLRSTGLSSRSLVSNVTMDGVKEVLVATGGNYTLVNSVIQNVNVTSSTWISSYTVLIVVTLPQR